MAETLRSSRSLVEHARARGTATGGSWITGCGCGKRLAKHCSGCGNRPGSAVRSEGERKRFIVTRPRCVDSHDHGSMLEEDAVAKAEDSETTKVGIPRGTNGSCNAPKHLTCWRRISGDASFFKHSALIGTRRKRTYVRVSLSIVSRRFRPRP